MSDIRLFRTADTAVVELGGGQVALEKSLQSLFEKNLEPLLGVRFLASEFAMTDGRMDTLGIDENNNPVIIEYKRSSNENVINQGLFYLNWLMGHRKDFEWLVMDRFGEEAARTVDWSGPRLICIANDFTRYDEHAVKQMGRFIDLVRYRKFEGDLLLLEHVTSTAGTKSAAIAVGAATDAVPGKPKTKYKTVTEHLAEASQEMTDLYNLIRDYLLAQGDDVQEKTLDFYIAFRRMRNFSCVEVRNQLNKILVYARVDPDRVEIENGFTRDMRGIGHFGTGDLEITITSDDDFERAKPLFDRAYSNG